MADENIYISLFIGGKEEVLYKVERIFDLGSEDAMYCAVAPAVGGDTLFLRCLMSENGEETQFTVADITDVAEYNRVATAYEDAVTKEAMERVYGELNEYEDYITLKDADGKEVDFIIHTIFEDKDSGRSYVAMQKVDEAGDIFEEISLYRFIETEGEEHPVIDMIPSDMEYDRARKIFMGLIADENGLKP